MRWFPTLTALVLLSAPSIAGAQSLSLGAELGYDRVVDHGTSGIGLNVFPGISLGPIRAEAQIGYHRAVSDPLVLGTADLRTTYVPVMVGGRVGLPLGVLYPWVGAHGGFAYVGRRSGIGPGVLAATDHEWEPAFNVGAGAEVCLGGVGLGAAFWYDVAADDDDPMRIASAALTLRFAL